MVDGTYCSNIVFGWGVYRALTSPGKRSQTHVGATRASWGNV